MLSGFEAVLTAPHLQLLVMGVRRDTVDRDRAKCICRSKKYNFTHTSFGLTPNMHRLFFSGDRQSVTNGN
jgi:hypothetical protein